MSLEIQTYPIDPELAVPTATVDDLCERCRGIDFSSINATVPWRVTMHGPRGIMREVTLEAMIDQLVSSNCSLCRLFGSMGHSHAPGGYLARIGSFSAFGVYMRDGIYQGLLKQDIRDVILLGIFDGPHLSDLYSSNSKGYLSLHNSDQKSQPFGMRVCRVHPRKVNFKFIKESLHRCLEHHTDTCVIETSSADDLLVIDCSTLSVVTAPVDCQYVALSYVWNDIHAFQSYTSPEKVSSSLEEAPQTILDSIVISRQLDFQYLWVDRYCIVQSDNSQKLRQINQMDSIYAQAQLTIVAASPSEGIPGISESRKRQPSLRIGNWTLLSTLPLPKASLERSTWHTRGWTFQEGLLSVRRLVLTEDQAFFECNNMNCTESTVLRFDLMQISKGTKIETSNNSFVFREREFDGSSLNLMEQITRFYPRRLTFPSDTLRAMEGIFRRFSKDSPPTYKYQGIPIMHKYFRLALTGYPEISATDNFLLGLLWYHAQPGSRQGDFPSWTWAGWSGGSLMWIDGLSQFTLRNTYQIEVFVDHASGHGRVPFPDHAELPGFLGATQYPAPSLFISAPLVQVHLKMDDRSECDECRSSLAGKAVCCHFGSKDESTFDSFKPSLPFRFLADYEAIDWHTKDLHGIVLFSWPAEVMCVCHLLVIEQKEGYFERAGYAQSSCFPGYESSFHGVPRRSFELR